MWRGLWEASVWLSVCLPVPGRGEELASPQVARCAFQPFPVIQLIRTLSSCRTPVSVRWFQTRTGMTNVIYPLPPPLLTDQGSTVGS